MKLHLDWNTKILGDVFFGFFLFFLSVLLRLAEIIFNKNFVIFLVECNIMHIK